MQKSYLFYKVAAVVLLALAFQSCKKNHGVDNNIEVQTPYTLYYTDSAGNLFHTNSGDVQDRLRFPADGYPMRALYVIDSNILFIKKGMFYSKNDSNFNPTYLETGHLPNQLSYNQSMFLHAKDQGRIYICTNDGNGIAYSDQSGNPGSWTKDNNWDGGIVNLGIVNISSITQLDNGVIVGYDPVNNRTFAKNDAGGSWHETTFDPNDPTVGRLPDTSSWTLWHMGNTVIAIDSTSYNGIFFSTNNGNTWTQTTDPVLQHTRCFHISVIFNQVLMGTEKGVYRLVGGQFQPSNTGVVHDTRVRGFAGKEIIYKNGEIKQYIYMTCSKGLYRSVDQGHNWEFVRDGNLICVW